MKIARITTSGQLSIPAEIRRRWATSRVVVEDQGDRVVLRPFPDDPIAAARGALRGRLSVPTEKLREIARRDEQIAEDHKWGKFSTRTRSSR